MTDESSNISVLTPKSGANFSLSPLDSDYWGNLLVMEQVVGTLVKYSSHGNYEPDLAEGWSVSEDELKWEFLLKKDLVAEDGSIIDASQFAKSIKRLLKIYSKDYSPPTFNQLVGWSSFIEGDESSLGIKAVSDQKILFHFRTRPSGLLEFLSMPYYGFYADANFDNSDRWKSKSSIISSGKFKVSKYDENKIELIPRLRNNKFKINIFPGDVEDFHLISGPKILALKDARVHKETVNSYKLIESTPTYLESIVLSDKIVPFNNHDIRHAFKTLLKVSIQSKLNTNTNNLNGLYHSFTETLVNSTQAEEAQGFLKKFRHNLRAFTYDKKEANRDQSIRNIILETASKIGWTVSFVNPDTIGEDWQNILHTNEFAEIRIARVDTGTFPEPWVIDMMFCSKLGISFPDPDGSVCKLVDQYKRSSEKLDMRNFASSLEEIVRNSNCIVPIKHSGFQWLISNDIPDYIVTPTMNIPRLDRLIKN